MSTSELTNKPCMNVTPLIDVLLVLLIIFMVAAPLKPSRFLAKLPQEPDWNKMLPNIDTLVVTIESDHSLKLNSLTGMGTVEDTSRLSLTLAELFRERKKNLVFRDDMLTRPDLPVDSRIERTVFIKAPRAISYGAVAKVIDSVKGTGANPVGLQLDRLD